MNKQKLNLSIDRIVSLPASCANRGRYNEIKTTEFGGWLRARLSGQSLKRAVREAVNSKLENVDCGIRATNVVPTIKRMWEEEYKESPSWTPEEEDALRSNITAIITKGGNSDSLEKNAMIFLGNRELLAIARLLHDTPSYVTSLSSTELFDLKEAVKKHCESSDIKFKKFNITTADGKDKPTIKLVPTKYKDQVPSIAESLNSSTEDAKVFVLDETEEQLKALAKSSDSKKSREAAEEAITKLLLDNHFGPDVAINGRMSAGNKRLGVDSACQFSHAISLCAHEVEEDFFSAKDESEITDHRGAGIIGTGELGSHTYYAFSNLDISDVYEKLFSQGYDKNYIINLVLEYMEAAALALPSARQSTMFGKTLPHYVRITLRDNAQVFSRADAFVDVAKVEEEGGVIKDAVDRLRAHDEVEKAFGVENYLLKEEISPVLLKTKTDMKEVKEKLRILLESNL